MGSNRVKLQTGLTNEEVGNTVNLNFTLGASQEFDNTSGSTLVIGGNINFGANTLTIGGSYGETDLNGAISGSGGLIASTSSGRVVLAGSNTYQGTTQILSGTLAVSNATGLGAGGGTATMGTMLANGASLEIDGPLTISNELLTLNGASSNSSSYYYFDSNSTSSTGVNDWTGGITFASNTSNTSSLYLYAYTGSLEVDGNITGGSNAELVPGTGPLTLKGPSSSVGYFYAESGNTVVVDGSLSIYGQFDANYNTTTEVDGTLTCGYGDVYGTLSGVGTVTTSSSNDVYVYGQVAPGNASGPGTLTVGNFYFANGSSVSGQIASAMRL